MMTCDEFHSKFSKIEEAVGTEIRKTIIDEFGSWSHLAFAIFESMLYDRIKYADLCRNHMSVAKAQCLEDKLTEFREEYVKEFPR